MKLKKIGKVYHASFRTATGDTKTITTRCTNRDDAERAAAPIKELEQAARTGRLTNQAIGQIVAGRKLTVPKAIQDFYEWSKVTKDETTAYCQRQILDQWVRAGSLEHVPPSALTEQHIHDFVNDPSSKSRLTTRKTNLAAIRSFFGYLVAKGWSPADPSRLVRVNLNIIPHRLKEKEERQCFTRAEVKTILDYESRRIQKLAERRARIEWGRTLSPAHRRQLLTQRPEDIAKAEPVKVVADKLLQSWRDTYDTARAQVQAEEIFWSFAIRVADELAMRLGDVASLEWECFRRPGKIVVWTDKRDKRIEVPISAELQELLTCVPVNDSTHLFPHQRDINHDDTRRALLSTQFLRLCARAGVNGKSFHCLRHGTITRWHKEGRSLEDIGKDVGHSHARTTEGYIH